MLDKTVAMLAIIYHLVDVDLNVTLILKKKIIKIQ